MTPVLEAREVSRRYGDKAAVQRASLALQAGEITCLLGPSGSGKSTLLRLLAGLEPVDGGEVLARGERLSATGLHVAPERRDIGLVFQDYALFPHLTVEANVGFGLRRLPAAERRQRAMLQLERVRLADRARAYPQALSGGEQQRVALARAFVTEPPLLFADEPTGSLDAATGEAVIQLMFELNRERGSTLVLVTHDPSIAARCGRTITIAAGRLV